jgi:F-type H+-transporting ATPase subunit b
MSNPATSAGTEAPSSGFPPFKTETFPSQLFWLTITFVVLFVVVWRIANPMVQAVVKGRRNKIDGDIAAAAKHKADAEAALAAYNTALGDAKTRAHKLADETRKTINDEVEAAKAETDAQAKASAAEAEKRIAAMQVEAAKHVTKAAQDAAVAIVGRLIGDTVPPEEAERAVKAVGA